jgi:c-di-GMP-binding flagellar brake protein YcgR
MHPRSRSHAGAKHQELDLQSGHPVMVQFPGSSVRHKGVYVGGERQAYLVIRMLEPEKLDALPPTGGQVLGGCVKLGTVFAFEAETIGSIHEPFVLLFLSYPQTLQARRLRGSARVPSDIPARARLAHRELRGRLVDLSAGGCRFAVRARGAEPGIQPGAPIELVFLLLGGYGEQTVRGHVRTCDLEAGLLNVGIQFDEIDPAIREKIEAYVLGVLAFDQDPAA